MSLLPDPHPEDSLPQSAQTHAELARFRVAMDMSGDAIYLVDRESMLFVDVNHTACTRMGYSRDELLRMGPQDLLTSSREEIERLYDQVIAAGAAGTVMESSARTREGRLSITELHRRALRLGGRWIIVSIARDITRRKQTEQALLESELRFRLTFEHAGSGIAHVDLDGRFLQVNLSLCRILGFAREEFIGRTVKEFSHPEDLDKTDAARGLMRAGKLESIRAEKRYLHKNGEIVWVALTVALARDAGGEPMYEIAVFDDITVHKLSEARIQRVAHHDSLTGLPNRLLFNDRLQQALAQAKRNSRQFALLYLDLDRFKPVNDSFGHAIGDELLVNAGARLLRQVRESDTVARIGGDEFAVILADVARRDDAEAVARKIAAAIAAPFQLDDRRRRVEIGTSVGIAVYPADAQDADALVKFADRAMYRAKEARV
ncbi:MAG: diguanylate cyclase domain-containing protein [Betaproteobacteria bacterium]